MFNWLKNLFKSKSIIEIRKHTQKGSININTNGSKPDAVKALCEVGLNSIRVSTNSARKEIYTAYYKPNNYEFEDLIESLKVARSFGAWTSINYFVFPGMTDSIEEYEPQGGGGTDFDCIFEYLKENAIDPKRLIVFTDGYPCGSWGDPDYCDTTWIIHGDKNPNPPFGTFAIYDETN